MKLSVTWAWHIDLADRTTTVDLPKGYVTEGQVQAAVMRTEGRPVSDTQYMTIRRVSRG